MADRRLEKRMPVELTIEVSGFDCSSGYFSERTETCDVSESGCKFRLHTVLAPETVVAVRALCQCETEVSPKGRVVSDRSPRSRASRGIDGSASIAAVSAARTSMGNLISLTTLRIVVFCDTSHASLGARWVRGRWLREAASISRRESTRRVFCNGSLRADRFISRRSRRADVAFRKPPSQNHSSDDASQAGSLRVGHS